jgi:DNA-binding transcriptional MerR regulator
MFRYEVAVDGRPHPVVLSGDPVAVAYAEGGWAAELVEFWAEHDEGGPQVTREFQVLGTGEPLPPGARHAGTCPGAPDGRVFHLYELPGSGPAAGPAEEGRSLPSAEAAAVLGVAPHVLLRLEEQGRIAPWRTPGGTRRYPAAVLERLRGEMEAEAAGLLSTAETAALLGVGSATVLRYAAAGKLAPVPRQGKVKWFRESEVRALLGGGEP